MTTQSKARALSVPTQDRGFESRLGQECLSLVSLISHPRSPNACHKTDREIINLGEKSLSTGKLKKIWYWYVGSEIGTRVTIVRWKTAGIQISF